MRDRGRDIPESIQKPTQEPSLAVPYPMQQANEHQVGGDHYQTSVQHWDYVIANNIPYLEAQIIRYLSRWRKKDGIADLLKAQHYLQKLFEVTGIAWDPPMETAMGTEAAEPGPGYVNQDPDVPRMARRKVPTVHPR
jgi:hypothetical protein